MRRSALMVVILALAIGAGPGEKTPPLPPLNEKVVEFAKRNLGKPVGNGICITLAVEALRAAGAKPGSFRDPKGDYTWGEPIADLKDALPGDVLQFRDAVFQGQRPLGRGRTIHWHQEYPHHTAIVAKVEKTGKLITIYHQNVQTQGKDESEKGNVQEGELRMDCLQKGGWVKAYRPVEVDRKPPRKPFAGDADPDL